MNSSGDMMAFRLQNSSFHYQLRLEGSVVTNVHSFQGCPVSSDNAHLCILDVEKRLGYYHWKGGKWQTVRTWQQVSPFFQSTFDPLGRFHLIATTPGKTHFYSYLGPTEQESELSFLVPDPLLLQLYSIDEDNLFLFQKENSESGYSIVYYNYHSPSDSWSEKTPVANLSLACHDLQFFLSEGMVYLTYKTPNSNNNLLNLLTINTDSGEIVDNCLDRLSSAAGLPVIAKLGEEIVLLVLEPNNLIFWRSGDGGQTWTTKGELPCPWPLKLAPVLNPQKEITPWVALEGFYGLEFSQPGLLTTKELLGLSPYGLWL